MKLISIGSCLDWLEELRTGRYAEQIWIRAVCQVEESPHQGSSLSNPCPKGTRDRNATVTDTYSFANKTRALLSQESSVRYLTHTNLLLVLCTYVCMRHRIDDSSRD